MASVWRLAAGQRLISRSWDDECVLYNDLSGATHLLGAAALHLLQRLRAGDADVDTLVASLQAEFDTAPGTDLQADVAAMLDALHGHYLIAPLP
jgi:PqqD family protein of HPr-rel-A system